MGRKKNNLSCWGEKKTYPHIEGEKVHTWDLSYSEGRRGGHSQKEGIFLICDNDIPIQSAACRWMLWTSNIVWSMPSLCT